MKKLRKWIKITRVLRLRVLGIVLVLGSVAYIAANLVDLNRSFKATGSLTEMGRTAWRSGEVVTEILDEGMFQLFVLILGWSLFFRLRTHELGHLRLRRSEQKYRSIINHAGEAVFLLDRKGRVLEWNKKAEVLFRLPRRNILNRRMQDLELGLDLDIQSIFENILRVGRGLTHETQINHPGSPGEKSGGWPTQVSMTFSFISPGAGLTADKDGSFVVIARDITSQKQLETRMGEAEKLAGIGQLAAGIAHQLNTPLGSILLSAQMLEDTVRGEDEVEDIRRIIRQTDQCRGIIKGLLNFARPTGSERGSLDLEHALNETAFLMEKNLKVAGVELTVNRHTDPRIYGNRNELEQVFFNLLANALDAMPAGGHVDVDILDGGAGEIVVVFKDTGEGVSRDAADRIFLPFFTTKDYGKGTGLGLSIVARIVHEHGGRIELDSEPGQGATFRMWLPRARDRSAGKRGALALIDDEALPEEPSS